MWFQSSGEKKGRAGVAWISPTSLPSPFLTTSPNSKSGTIIAPTLRVIVKVNITEIM